MEGGSVSLVLLATVIVIWASLLLPLIFRDRSTWPSRQAPARTVPGDPATVTALRGRAVWRPAASPPRDRGRRGLRRGPRDRRLQPAHGRAAHPSRARSTRGQAGGRSGARPGLGAAARRAVLRRRRLLVLLVAAALAALLPAITLGGTWRPVAAAAGALPAAYLAALGASATHRRRAAAGPGRSPRSLHAIHRRRRRRGRPARPGTSTTSPIRLRGTFTPLPEPAAPEPDPLEPAAPEPDPLGPAALVRGLRAWRASRAGADNGADRWAALLPGHAPPSAE